MYHFIQTIPLPIHCSYFIVSHDKLTIEIPPMERIENNKTLKVLSLEKLHLEALATTGKMDYITQQYFTATYLALSIVLILVICLRTCKRQKTIFTQQPTHTPHVVESAIPSLWPSLRTRGGGVTMPSINPPQQPPPPMKPAR